MEVVLFLVGRFGGRVGGNLSGDGRGFGGGNLGGRGGGRVSRLRHGHAAGDELLEVGQRQGIACAGLGQHVALEIVVHILLEGEHGGGGSAAVVAVIGAGGQQTRFDQHLLDVLDGFLGGIGVHVEVVLFLVGHVGRRGRSGGRGSGGQHGFGGGGRLLEALPPFDVVIQIRHGIGIDHAGDGQRFIALQLVDALLELLDRRHGGGAVDAVVAAGGHQTQHDQLALHRLDIGLGGILVHGTVVGVGGDGGRGRRGGLDRLGGIEPLQGLGTGDAVHAQLFGGLEGIVDVGLEVLHRLLGGGIILAGDLLGGQPAQRGEALLQRGDLRGGGILVDGVVVVAGGIAQRGLRRGGGRLVELILELLVHVAGIGIVHPALLRVHQRGEGGRNIGRGACGDLGRPEVRSGIGREGGVLHHVVGGAQRAVHQRHDHDGGDDHHGGSNADDHADLLEAGAGILARGGGSGCRGCAGLALGDIGGAVFLKIEVALLGILHAFHAGAELAHALFKLVLAVCGGHDGTVVEPFGAVAGQVFAQAHFIFALGIERRIDDAGGVLTEGAAHEEPVVVHQRAGQHLDLRHGGAGIASAMGADRLTLQVLEAVHAKMFVCHLFHSLPVKISGFIAAGSHLSNALCFGDRLKPLPQWR